MKKMFIAGLIAFAFPLAAFAQVSTVTGTLSSGGTVTSTSTSGSSLSGTVTPPPGSGSLTGTVGGGSGSLTGTVTSPSASGTSGGGGGSVGSNGPPVGGGGGGGPDTTIVCPNLPDSLYSLPAGYVVIDGDCDPSSGVGSVLGASTTVPNLPDTGTGGEAPIDLAVMFSSLITAVGGVGTLLRLRRG